MQQVLPNDEFNRTLVANVAPPDWHNPTPAGRYNLVVIGAGTAGLVTFERLMERIVGGMGYDAPQRAEQISTRGDGSAVLDGLTLVADVNERFGLHIDNTIYRTLGGYVLGRLGRRARLGDRIEAEGHTMVVEALDGLRVAKVLISRPRVTRETSPEDSDVG